MNKHPARILLFAQGGRMDDYRADWARLELQPENGSTKFGCEIRTTTNVNLTLGQHLPVTVVFFNEVDSARHVLAGNVFSLFEGARHVGDGVWTLV